MLAEARAADLIDLLAQKIYISVFSRQAYDVEHLLRTHGKKVMPRFYRRVARKAGLSPGTLRPREERPQKEVKLLLFDFDRDNYQERELHSVEEAIPFKELPTVTWLCVDGPADAAMLETLGNAFDVHPLVLEDIQNVGQRPKLENYETHAYVVIRLLHYDKDQQQINGEQMSLIVGSNFVITFQETDSTIFDIIRQRIRNNESRLRKSGSDYLAYRLLDTVIDDYFVILENVGENLDTLEGELMSDPDQSTLEDIYRLKRELLFLRKSIWPIREVLSNLTRGDSQFFKKSTEVFIRDVYDHAVQIIDTTENFRDISTGMLDTYISIVSNRMNEVMKVLTIIATIFIPLTFIAGIYGMNFEVMPELKLSWGYPAVWAVMIIVGIVMLVYFRKKKWL